jgi:hypothetical protein
MTTIVQNPQNPLTFGNHPGGSIMLKPLLIATLALSATALTAETAAHGHQPYAGLEARQIKSLSPDDIAELRTGGRIQSLILGDLATSTGFEARVPKDIPPGLYDLWVINPDSQFDVRKDAYEALATQ